MGAEAVPQAEDPAAPQPHVEAPSVDAWLERRLRVFERALSHIESRQEKTERSLTQQIALLESQLAALSALRDVALSESAPPGPAVSDVAFVPEPMAETALSVEAADTKDIQVESSGADPLVLPPWKPDTPPPDEKAVAEAVAHARQAAREAAVAQPQPRARKRPAQWLLPLAGAIGLLALACLGIVLGNVASATRVEARSGVAHRQTVRGLERIMAMADSGNAMAETVLALDYLHGKDVTADRAAALRWSVAAAGQHYPLAQYVLGMVLLDNGDRAGAARWFRAAAEQGNVRAMHNLAIAFLEGEGVAKDMHKAVDWFTRAASQGYRDSAFDLAVLYERGQGVPQDARTALKWYLVAARAGDTQSAARAAFLRGQMRGRDADGAVEDAAAFVAVPASPFANRVPLL